VTVSKNNIFVVSTSTISQISPSGDTISSAELPQAVIAYAIEKLYSNWFAILGFYNGNIKILV
jgi:hypothetical protein